jgi:hypothetical protein
MNWFCAFIRWSVPILRPYLKHDNPFVTCKVLFNASRLLLLDFYESRGLNATLAVLRATSVSTQHFPIFLKNGHLQKRKFRRQLK